LVASSESDARAKTGYRKNFIDMVDTIKLFGKVDGQKGG
jgi:hypothetical protein